MLALSYGWGVRELMRSALRGAAYLEILGIDPSSVELVAPEWTLLVHITMLPMAIGAAILVQACDQ